MSCYCEKIERFTCLSCSLAAVWKEIEIGDQVKMLAMSKFLDEKDLKGNEETFKKLLTSLGDLCPSDVPESEKYWK